MLEYKFVKIKVGAPSLFASRREPLEDYHQIIRDHAKENWELVQIFSPVIEGRAWGSSGAFYEMIFKRPAKD